MFIFGLAATGHISSRIPAKSPWKIQTFWQRQGAYPRHCPALSCRCPQLQQDNPTRKPGRVVSRKVENVEMFGQIAHLTCCTWWVGHQFPLQVAFPLLGHHGFPNRIYQVSWIYLSILMGEDGWYSRPLTNLVTHIVSGFNSPTPLVPICHLPINGQISHRCRRNNP